MITVYYIYCIWYYIYVRYTSASRFTSCRTVLYNIKPFRSSLEELHKVKEDVHSTLTWEWDRGLEVNTCDLKVRTLSLLRFMMHSLDSIHSLTFILSLSLSLYIYIHSVATQVQHLRPDGPEERWWPPESPLHPPHQRKKNKHLRRWEGKTRYHLKGRLTFS